MGLWSSLRIFRARFPDTDNRDSESGWQLPEIELVASTLPGATVSLVKFVDDGGELIESDARQLLGVEELSTVVITGKAQRDETGNLTVLGTGLFVQND